MKEANDQYQNTEKQVRSALKKKLRRRRIKRLINYLIIIAIILVVAYGYRYYKEHGRLPFSREAAVTVESSRVSEVKVTETSYSQVIDLSGSVEAYQTQTVVFRSTGAVTGVYAKEGDSVKEGDLLATIDDTSQMYNVANYESRIEEARLSGSKRELELLEMQLSMAKNNLDYTKAYANFDGLVASVNINKGDFSEAGNRAMVIIDRSKLKATVEVDEIDIQDVEIGMEAILTFDAISGENVIGRVSYVPMIGRTTNQGIGVLDVELVIDNPPAAVYPGFTFAGSISIPFEGSMLIIPASAITTSRNVSTVNKKGADGKPIRVTVTTKYLGEGMHQVLSGDLKVGDTLLVTASGPSSLFNIMATPGSGGGGGMGSPMIGR